MKISTRIFTLMLLLSLQGVQCAKKYTCSHSNIYQPVSVAFIGYTAAQLETIIIVSFAANTGLANPLSADTFHSGQVLREGDTTYNFLDTFHYHRGFIKATGGLDYKVILPAVAKEYIISEIREGESISTWEQKNHCSPGAGAANIVPLHSTVSGGNYENGYAEANNYYIFLKL